MQGAGAPQPDVAGLKSRHDELRARNAELSTDNTALRAQVQKLLLARTGFRDLLDAMDIATVFLDAGLQLTHYTPAAAALLHLSPDDVGRRFPELAPQLPYPELADDAARVLSQDSSSDRDLGHLDGNWYLARLLPHRTPEEGVIGVMLNFVDISTRRTAERSHRWLSTVVGASQDAVISFDLGMRVLSWNPGAQVLFGYTAEEMIGRSLARLARGCEADQLRNLDRVRSGESFQAGAVRLRKDGREVQVSLNAAPIRDADGRVIGGVAIARDVGDTQRAQEALQRSSEELRAALKELEAADAAKDHFLAVLSHELRNPLASVAGAVEVLADSRIGAGDREAALGIARRQLDATRRLLDDLLDVTRLRLGRLTLHKEPVRLADVIATAVETAGPALARRGHELHLDLPSVPVVLQADGLRLTQLLANLLVNSARYTPPGGHVRLAAGVHGRQLHVEVEDDGIGMDAAELQHVFEMFAQASGGQAQGSGLGIGLALARNIAQLHGGTLSAASPGRGQGCRMTLTLPLAADESMPPPAHAPSPSPTAAPGTGTTVLLVDDNADAVWGLRIMLEMAGHRVLTAGTGAEALEVADRERPPVLLLDIGLPDMSGLDLARRIRESAWGRGAALVALTGLGRDSDVRESAEAGFDAHLTKPAEMAQLRKLLAELPRRQPAD